jgi:hypothetical protein
LSPLWISFFESRRHATLFTVTMGIVILSVTVVVASRVDDIHKYIITALSVVGGLGMVCVCLEVRRFRIWRRERFRYPRLSDDELRVARIKLTKNRFRSR